MLPISTICFSPTQCTACVVRTYIGVRGQMMRNITFPKHYSFQHTFPKSAIKKKCKLTFITRHNILHGWVGGWGMGLLWGILRQAK